MTYTLSPYHRTNWLTDAEWLRAVYLWNQGFDTNQIARQMGCSEALIHNKLPLWRAKHPKIGEAVA